MKNFFAQYGLYLIRWQLSSPILAIVLILQTNSDTLTATIIANFIGGLIFFWIDRLIFNKSAAKVPLWEIKENVKCADCATVGYGYRIVSWFKYDRKNDKNPQFRCDVCCRLKMAEVQQRIGCKKST